jgi:hypothetical protein
MASPVTERRVVTAPVRARARPTRPHRDFAKPWQPHQNGRWTGSSMAAATGCHRSPPAVAVCSHGGATGRLCRGPRRVVLRGRRRRSGRRGRTSRFRIRVRDRRSQVLVRGARHRLGRPTSTPRRRGARHHATAPRTRRAVRRTHRLHAASPGQRSARPGAGGRHVACARDRFPRTGRSRRQHRRRVMKRNRRLEMRCSRRQIERRSDTLDVIRQIPDIDGTPLPQELMETEPFRLDRPPRSHHLTSDTVPKDPLTPNHQDVHALSRQRDGQRRASKPAADHNHVETRRRFTAATLVHLQTLQSRGSPRHPGSVQGAFQHTRAGKSSSPAGVGRSSSSRRRAGWLRRARRCESVAGASGGTPVTNRAGSSCRRA